MPRAGRITAYSLVWIALLALFGTGVWWVVHNAPAAVIQPDQIAASGQRATNGAGASIDERLSATDLTLRDAQWTVNSDDGKVTMRLRAHEGSKQKSLYSIREGSLQFSLNDKEKKTERETLVLTLKDATYSAEAGLVRVKGTLIGQIAEGGHYFKADELSWDQSRSSVSTKEVQYRGPNVDVSGKQMSIDLQTGQVRFDGPVDVGI